MDTPIATGSGAGGGPTPARRRLGRMSIGSARSNSQGQRMPRLSVRIHHPCSTTTTRAASYSRPLYACTSLGHAPLEAHLWVVFPLVECQSALTLRSTMTKQSVASGTRMHWFAEPLSSTTPTPNSQLGTPFPNHTVAATASHLEHHWRALRVQQGVPPTPKSRRCTPPPSSSQPRT